MNTRDVYLEELGIPKFLYLKKNTKSQDNIKTNTKCLVVENAKKDSFCQAGKQQDFLFKMLGAIGLSKDDIELVNTDDISIVKKYSTKTVLIMDENLTLKDSFKTHHPSQILKNSDLKREAWEELKKIQKCLK